MKKTIDRGGDFSSPRQLCFRVQSFADFAREIGKAERLFQECHAGIHDALMYEGMFRVGRGENNFYRGIRLRDMFRKFYPIHFWHHDIGEQ